RHGFFPRGGGRIEIDIEPAPLRRMEFTERGTKQGRSGMIVFSPLGANKIPNRVRKAALKALPEWDEEMIAIRDLPADQGPGIALSLEAAYENVTEVVSGFGKIGLSAERIGNTAGKRMAGYEASKAFAGPYLQDQLLLPIALAGGGIFTTVKISQHTCTAADIIGLFTGRSTHFEDAGENGHKVRIV
ncbi:MAG: RNA 3'-terminal phosphate cyclase, partial [Qipengyuania vulgaris]